jgi:drug/metabolite transporter (DMT)-like permease
MVLFPAMREETSPPALKLALAFAAIYLIWGSTYVAIHYAIQTLPGFLMAAMRFTIAGGALYIWAWSQGARLTGQTPRRTAFTMGLLLLFLGHGSVVLAIHWVSSGLAAVLLCTTPIWVALIEWGLPGGKRPGGRVSTGILLGFLGIVMLIGIGDLRNDQVDLLGVGILVVSSIAWSGGTIYARRRHVSTSPLMTSSVQMLAGGILLFIAAILNGDFDRFHADTVSVSSALAFGYLTLFGSIIAFTAFSWLVQVTSPARVVTSSYVNPVIAVLLGHAIAGEALTYRMMLAMLMIVLGVIVITSAPRAKAKIPVMVRTTADDTV